MPGAQPLKTHLFVLKAAPGTSFVAFPGAGPTLELVRMEHLLQNSSWSGLRGPCGYFQEASIGLKVDLRFKGAGGPIQRVTDRQSTLHEC